MGLVVLIYAYLGPKLSKPSTPESAYRVATSNTSMSARRSILRAILFLSRLAFLSESRNR